MRAQCVESDITMMLRIKSTVGKLGCHVPLESRHTGTRLSCHEFKRKVCSCGNLFFQCVAPLNNLMRAQYINKGKWTFSPRHFLDLPYLVVVCFYQAPCPLARFHSFCLLLDPLYPFGARFVYRNLCDSRCSLNPGSVALTSLDAIICLSIFGLQCS